jgi:pteridine reductase
MASMLRGKVALITGSAKRIGRATALALAREGADVVVHYHRSAKEAADLGHELAALGVRAWTLQADFRVPAQLSRLCDQAADVAGRLDLLVNNASIFPRDTLDDVSLESMTANVEVNAWAPLALSRAFAARAGSGAIINLLDSRIDDFDWAHVGYMVSKHVLAALTTALALHYAPRLRVNAVAPGLVLPPPGESHDYIERLRDTVPLRKHGEPEDVAEAVVYLAKSEFLTGELIYVDGGRHLREYARG